MERKLSLVREVLETIARVEDFRSSEVIDELPLHIRDFSRELGGIFLNFTFTYGIISIWIKTYI